MFVLGKFAEAFPDVVREIDKEGHEIASHGYGHVEVFRQSRAEFAQDIYRGKQVIEQAIGRSVLGYRAPDFSIVTQTLWALPVIAEAGFLYDSSIFPVKHRRYGIPNWPVHPIRLRMLNEYSLIEAPIAAISLFGKNWPVGGGGYHRLLPGIVSRTCARRTMADAPFMFYCHPYEFDRAEFRCLSFRVPTAVRLHQGLGRRWFKGRFTRFVDAFGGQRAADLLFSTEWPTFFLNEHSVRPLKDLSSTPLSS